MKVLIFDSGTLINLSMNGLLNILENLKRDFDGKFIITNAVKYETIDRPIGIQKFELGALKIQWLLEKGILEMPDSLDVDEKELKALTEKFLTKANHIMQSKGVWIKLVSEAEISCLALSAILSKRKIESLIAVDERTTRLICENPRNLERIMSEKTHQRVTLVETNLEEFQDFRFIRSSEIAFVAYKKGLLRLSGKKVLEALLYATKYKGSAISYEEIDVLKKL
ncbi:MAG: hypothetical protein WCK90_04915 [archaeon]